MHKINITIVVKLPAQAIGYQKSKAYYLSAYNLPSSSTTRLQIVLNSAARAVTKASKFPSAVARGGRTGRLPRAQTRGRKNGLRKKFFEGARNRAGFRGPRGPGP
jgi:hypothetical protein